MKLVATSTELAVLRAGCSKNIAVSGTVLSGLDESYFHNSFTSETYNRLVKLNRKNGQVPTWRDLCDDPGLKEETREKLRAVSADKITNRAEALNAVKTLQSYRQLRGMYQMCEDVVTALKKKKVDHEELLTEMANSIVTLRQSKTEEKAVLTFGKGNNVTQRVKNLLDEEKANFLPTGFSAFDDENGGIGFGNLFVLGGSTGGGKSTLSAQLAYNWADMGEDVVMVPLEMSEDEMLARTMANAASIDVRKILFRRMSEDEKTKYWKAYKRFIKKKKKAGGSFRVFKPTSDMTIEEIMASIYPLGSRVVIIDYISLLKGVDGDDAWQKLGAVARYCKIYAEAHNIIVVLLCQVSDDGVIRYARSIAEHANYAWKFVATAATRENEIINIEQLKARNGRMFDFTLRALMAFMQVRDLDVEEKEELHSKGNTSKSTHKKGGHPSKNKDKDETPAKAKPDKAYLQDLSDEE